MNFDPPGDGEESSDGNTQDRLAEHTESHRETAAELARADVNHGACRSGESGKILQREERRITAASAGAQESKEGRETTKDEMNRNGEAQP